MTPCSSISCNLSIETPQLESYTHTIYKESNEVYAKDTDNNIVSNGTFNQVLSSTAKSGNRLIVKDGNYYLTELKLPDNVILDAESRNVKIEAPDTQYLIYLKSNSAIRNFSFDHDGNTMAIYVKGNVRNWIIDNNYFYGATMAVLVENLTTEFPTSGYGYITNNEGLHSKLATLHGTRNVIVSGNIFHNKEDSEFMDFNYNVHHCLVENNEFINSDGYSLDQEAIDMLGGSESNSYNIVRNNTIIGNFQIGIRPALHALHNKIENNHIEFKQGKIENIAGIYLYGRGGKMTPENNKILNNKIIGWKTGIELSGSNNNEVSGNKISNTIKGISLLKDSSSGYGASISPLNNKISKNIIDDVDYGIYINSSPNNTITDDNIITNYRIKDIYSA